MIRVRLAIPACTLAALAAALLSATASQAAKRLSAEQLLNQAMTNAILAGSVHEASVQTLGTDRATYSDDVATSSGRQNITTSAGVVAHVLIVGKFAYISGNHTALVSYFGLPKAAAKAVGTRWISIPQTDSSYATVANDATLISALKDNATPTSPLSETAATKIDGQSVIGIRGGVPGAVAGETGNATLYLTRTSHPLPVYLKVSVKYKGQTGAYTATFSRWGEPLKLSPPAGAIPNSRL